MNTGAIVMLVVGAVGLWGGIIFFIRNYFQAAKAEREAAESREAENGESGDREAAERGETSNRESNDREPGDRES